MTNFHVELIQSLDVILERRDQWSQLHAASENPSPFQSFAWIHGWLSHLCEADQVRVLWVTDENHSVRAILPGYLSTFRIFRRFDLCCFNHASSGQTLHAGVLAADHDIEAIRYALKSICTLIPTVQMIRLHDICAGSDNDRAIKLLSRNKLLTCLDCTEKTYLYHTPQDWESFLAAKSKKFRKRISQTLKKLSKLNTFEYLVYRNEQVLTALDDLLSLDQKTWQGHLKRGMFKNAGEKKFIEQISLESSRPFDYYLFLVKFNGVQVSFMTIVTSGDMAYQLKTGYDSDYANYRPGLLVRIFATRYLLEQGINAFDMGVTANEEKSRWQSATVRVNSYFLLNRRSSMALLFYSRCRLINFLRTLKQRSVRDTAMRGL